MESAVKWLYGVMFLVLTWLAMQTAINWGHSNRLEVIEKRLNYTETECSGILYTIPEKPKGGIEP